MTVPERRAVAIVVIGLAANAAVDLSGYESQRIANVVWLLTLVGVLYLFLPGLPERLIDRWRGDRKWRALPPIWQEGFPEGRVMLYLEPPDGVRDEPVTCRVETPGGDIVEETVIPPKRARAAGVWNTHYFAVFPESVPLGNEQPPLAPGPYRVTWWSTRSVPGQRLLRVRRFRVHEDGSLR